MRALVPDQRRRPAGTAPLLDVIGAARRGTRTAFHAPGHKGGRAASADLRSLVGPEVLRADTWVGPSQWSAAMSRAGALAAGLWGAAGAHLLDGGSSAGNVASLLATLRDGDVVVVGRDAHTSVLHGLALSGARPVWVDPRDDPRTGLPVAVHPDDVAAAVRASPGVRLVCVTSPTYAGAVVPVAGLAHLAHSYGALLHVDQAWGPHLRWCGTGASDAVAAGADLVVTSLHKVVGALSAGALLLHSARVPAGRLAHAVAAGRTTSPLVPLLASVDAARRDLATDGHRMVGCAVELAGRLRSALAAVPGVEVADPGSGVWGSDPLKVVADVRGLGLSGQQVEGRMRAMGTPVEGADSTRVFLVVGTGDDGGTVDAVVATFAAVAGARAARGTAEPAVVPPPRPPRARAVLSPREAWQRGDCLVATRDAVDAVAAEPLTPYPPGVPVVVPGERLSAAVLDYLRSVVASGAHLHGAADPALRWVRVVAT